MLMPRKVAHRKHHRGRTSGLTKGGAHLAFGEYGIQALEPGWLSARQIEAARIAMTRAIKRGGKVWINIFPDKPVTKKPAETRMGSGKGNPEFWVAVVRPGRVLFELSFPNEETAKAALATNTKTWSLEFAPFGIRVGAVAPGMVETPMTQGMNQKARDALVAAIPVNRIGVPEDIWLAVRFIVECDYFNGRMIDVDGGLSM